MNAKKADSADFLEATDQKQVAFAAIGKALKVFVYRKPNDSLATMSAAWWAEFKRTQTSIGEIQTGLQARLKQAVSNPVLVQLVEEAVPESKGVIDAISGTGALHPALAAHA